MAKKLRTRMEFIPSAVAMTFIDNHDNQRSGDSEILTYKQAREYKMATAFELAWPYGIPQIMSSYAFDVSNTGPPMYSNETLISPSIKNDESCGNGYICEHRWRQISNMILFSNAVKGSKVENWYDNGNNQIAFSRGNIGFIVFNGEFNQPLYLNLQTGLPAGTYCDIVSGQRCEKFCTGSSVVVGTDGRANFYLPVGSADGFIAIFRNSRIPNS